MKIMRLILFLVLPLLLSSCNSWYQAHLNSRGIAPEKKSYFLTSTDSTKTHSLEFKEYAAVLKTRLNDAGYTETSPNEADLIILFDYQLGDTFLAGSNTDSFTFSNTNNYTSANSSSNANATVKTNANDNSTKASGNASNNTDIKSSGYSVSNTTTSSENTYRIPLLVFISAIENRSNEPIWEVIVRDDLDRETQLQSVMPWLILSAQPYFGKNSGGEIETRIYNKKSTREKYNLSWPYPDY